MLTKIFNLLILLNLTIAIQAYSGCSGNTRISEKSLTEEQKTLLDNIKDSKLKEQAKAAFQHLYKDIINKESGLLIMALDIKDRSKDKSKRRDEEEIVEDIEILLRLGIDVNDKNCGSMALRYALGVGQDKVAQFLLQQPGVDIDYLDPQTGKTPLHEAVTSASAETVKLLLDKKPNVNSYSHRTKQQGDIVYGRYGTPLHNLLFKPKETFKMKLVDKEGWYVEQEYEGLEDYLKERERILNLLLNFLGIDINVKDSAGDTPLAYVQEQIDDLNAPYRWKRKEDIQELQFLNLVRAALIGLGAKQ